MYFDTSGLYILVGFGILYLMYRWVNASVLAVKKLATENDEEYNFTNDKKSIVRIVGCILAIVLYVMVLPVRTALDDSVTTSFKAEFNEVTEEDRIRVEDTLTREHREGRLEELRIRTQEISDEVEAEYQELKNSQNNDKGDN